MTKMLISQKVEEESNAPKQILPNNQWDKEMEA